MQCAKTMHWNGNKNSNNSDKNRLKGGIKRLLGGRNASKKRNKNEMCLKGDEERA